MSCAPASSPATKPPTDRPGAAPRPAEPCVFGASCALRTDPAEHVRGRLGAGTRRPASPQIKGLRRVHLGARNTKPALCSGPPRLCVPRLCRSGLRIVLAEHEEHQEHRFWIRGEERGKARQHRTMRKVHALRWNGATVVCGQWRGGRCVTEPTRDANSNRLRNVCQSARPRRERAAASAGASRLINSTDTG